MSAYISFKKSLIFLLCGLVCSALIAFLLGLFLARPKLGMVYDIFMEHKPPSSVSNEILIINTDDFVESSDIFSVLMILTEMEAANLLLTARVLGSASPITGTETEIRRRFYDEYVILGNNIRNLFEAIRSGSIQPAQAPQYVERLVDLTEQSRERLLGVLIDRDEDLLRSAAVFGNYIEVDMPPVIDRDGKIRRVNPVEIESGLEHPVYKILKHRYVVSEIKQLEIGHELVIRHFNNDEWIIPLDKNGNILVTANADNFKNIDINMFTEYEDADRALNRVMRNADLIGAFSKTLPENSPLFLYEYALVLRDELLKSPDNEKRGAWINARYNYFKSLEDYLFGPAEMQLVQGFEEVIADEVTLDDIGRNKLLDMRDEMINAFYVMREHYAELINIHNIFKETLPASFCIMGPKERTAYSALLANTLITGSHIKPAWDRFALYWTIAASLIILLIIFRIRPVILLIAGSCLSIIAAIGFGAYFVLTSLWIDPTIVLVSSLCGTILIFICKCVTLHKRTSRFKMAYSACVSNDVLKNIINLGKPEINRISITASAVIAIRDFNLLKIEDKEKASEAGKAQKLFYSQVKEIVYNAGGVIAGFQGDTVIICFGSPFDNEKEIAFGPDPIEKAHALVKQLLYSEKKSWRFGIDAGKCAFSWSPETGFTANGRPVVRAKILASKNARYNTKALVTDAIREETNLNIRQVGFLYNETDAFYELKC